MYGGASVGEMLIGMNKVEAYKPEDVQKIQSNLTNLLHAKKNCATPDCVELRKFIGDFIQHKMTRKNNRKPVRHALPPRGSKPGTTGVTVKPRNAPPPSGPAPNFATPAGRAKAAAAANLANRTPQGLLNNAEKEAEAADVLPGPNFEKAAAALKAAPAPNYATAAARERANREERLRVAKNEMSAGIEANTQKRKAAVANKEANNWNAARNLAGQSAAKENAAKPLTPASTQNFLNLLPPPAAPKPANAAAAKAAKNAAAANLANRAPQGLLNNAEEEAEAEAEAEAAAAAAAATPPLPYQYAATKAAAAPPPASSQNFLNLLPPPAAPKPASTQNFLNLLPKSRKNRKNRKNRKLRTRRNRR
jgi:hypothetical protein